ncbi:MAG: hypothetical protein HXX16_20140 [Bacteroidales bacterium]|nr:hypothetical protein [Bacteroidales bacterium]
MKKLIVLFISIFLILLSNVNAQNFQIGPELKFGRIGLQNSYPHPSIIKLFDNSFADYNSIGIIGSYRPHSSIFSFKTGIIYSHIGNNNPPDEYNKLVIIQIPIGCDIKFGKKLFLFVGAGIDINYLLPQKKETLVFPDFQLGLYAELGIGYELNKKWSFELKHSMASDITKLYKTEYQLQNGLSNEKIYSTSADLGISIKYTFEK